MEKYKYTGPTMRLGKYDNIELAKGCLVAAEVNINVATITKIYDANGSVTVLNDAKVDVAAKYLEPIKPKTIHFDPKDGDTKLKLFNTKDFFDELNESIKKFPFSGNDNDGGMARGWDNICQRAWGEKYGDTYHTPKKVMDAINDDFDVILSEISDTHKAKNHDYGDSFTELYKECGSTYAYAHLKEKLNRIKTLGKSRQMVKKESMEDSLLDLASYAIMWVCELRKEKKDGAHN